MSKDCARTEPLSAWRRRSSWPSSPPLHVGPANPHSASEGIPWSSTCWAVREAVFRSGRHAQRRSRVP
eukprot:5343512-Alexandrium_andersonii.AAC.1